MFDAPGASFLCPSGSRTTAGAAERFHGSPGDPGEQAERWPNHRHPAAATSEAGGTRGAFGGRAHTAERRFRAFLRTLAPKSGNGGVRARASPSLPAATGEARPGQAPLPPGRRPSPAAPRGGRGFAPRPPGGAAGARPRSRSCPGLPRPQPHWRGPMAVSAMPPPIVRRWQSPPPPPPPAGRRSQ